MKGALMMLKALGVEITPEQAAMIEALIPQLPARVNQAIGIINDMAERQKRIEEKLDKLTIGGA